MKLDKQLLVRVSENLLVELRKTANNQRQSVSAILRQLITELLENTREA